MRKSFKKIGTTVTSTVMAAGMVLGPVSSVHAEEITAPLTANDGSETMAEVTDPATVETPAETPILHNLFNIKIFLSVNEFYFMIL